MTSISDFTYHSSQESHSLDNKKTKEEDWSVE